NAKESIELSLELVEKAKSIQNDTLLIKTIQETAYAHWYLGNYDEGIKLCNDLIPLLESQHKELVINITAQNQLLLGNLNGDKGKPKDSLQYYTDSLKLYQEAENTLGIGYAFNNIGEVYRIQGKLDESLVCYLRSKEHFEQLDNQLDVAMTLSNMAEVYREKGELKSALDFAFQSRNIQITLEDNYVVAFTDITIGLIYHSQGNLNEAIKYYKSSVDTLSLRNNVLWTSQALYYYILALVEVDLDESTKQLQLMQSLIEGNHEEVKLIDLQYKVLRAVILKKSKTLSNLIKAQDLFTEIVKSKDIIDYSISILAMKHLAEILLIELKLFNNPDTLREFIELIIDLRNIAELHGSILLEIQIYILIAKLKAIDGEYQSINESLEFAYKLAKEKELSKFVKEIEKVRSEILDEINKYSGSELEFEEIKKKVNQMNVEAYLNEILLSEILSRKK
ncbi:MAG: tetratricopeptide repeat protein, partial [Candidatus Heimdallarchaeota archaeon]